MNNQIHPQYKSDRIRTDRLISLNNKLSKSQLVEIATLAMRYSKFNGAEDIKEDLNKIMKKYGYNENSLYEETRKLWLSGFRPDQELNENI